ncbi:MAG TPA: hypothetical protein VED40_21140 [Azospirillaceae bacterium]|nr:hypothetical protein [Azospirillaceae bacterium]
MPFITLEDTDNRAISVNTDSIRSITKWRDRDEKPTLMIRYLNGDSEHVYGDFDAITAQLGKK